MKYLIQFKNIKFVYFQNRALNILCILMKTLRCSVFDANSGKSTEIMAGL